MSAASLGVIVDGAALSDDEARTVWGRFSAYMEEHKGDLGGFAAQEGYVSVHPEMRGGQAVLVISRTAPQGVYASAPERSQGAPQGLPAGGQRARVHRGGRGRR